MEGARRCNNAEIALGALVSFIAIMITAAILSSLLIGIMQTTFNNSHEHAATQSETINGLIQVNRFELSSYSNPGNDGLYLMFEFPYLTNQLSDTDVVWSLLCPGASSIQYISGDFDTATEITDDGATAASNDFFVNSGMYHIIIDTTGVCDISPDFNGELVIAINGGRTKTLPFDVGASPSPGMIFI